jgi:hypothetical protein
MCTQALEAKEVGVKAPPPYLVATGLGNDGLAHAGQQRTNHQHRAAQLGTLLHKLIALQIVQVEVIGLEGESPPYGPRGGFITLQDMSVTIGGRQGGYLHADILQQLDEVVDIADVGNVADSDRLAGEQRGTDDLQGLVFGTLRRDGSTERMSALYDE